MVTLALYKATGNWIDRLIRWRTNSMYSHCELIVGTYWYSSSPRDGGVRRKQIKVLDGHWDFINLKHIEADAVLELWQRTDGARYDWSCILPFRFTRSSPRSGQRWFCSEWCASAMGLPRPWSFTPGTLGLAARRMLH